MSDGICGNCKWWNNERSQKEYVRTVNDTGPYPADLTVGYCRAASNYSWGKAPTDRPFGGPPPKMMPTDWARYEAILFTHCDHGCRSFTEKREP